MNSWCGIAEKISIFYSYFVSNKVESWPSSIVDPPSIQALSRDTHVRVTAKHKHTRIFSSQIRENKKNICEYEARLPRNSILKCFEHYHTDTVQDFLDPCQEQLLTMHFNTQSYKIKTHLYAEWKWRAQTRCRIGHEVNSSSFQFSRQRHSLNSI